MARHYGMDWLRIGAFGLLILYHIGMFFVHWPWHVKTAEPLEWTAVPMLATNAWRLPLLFVVSGYASAALLAKGGSFAGFARSRTARLLVPLVFALTVIVPPQPWVELVTQHGYARDFWSFWTRDYFRFEEIGGLKLPTWQHLWFVAYLWVYTLALALLLAVAPGRRRIASAVDRTLAGIGVLLVPLALLLLNLVFSWPGSPETHALVDDWGAHRIYFSVFLFGVFLRGAERTWLGIRRWWKLAAALSLLGYAVVAGVEIVWPGNARPPAHWLAIYGVARIVQGWCAIVALIGVADRWWNRDHPLRPILTEAVFPFYIIHQTIIVVTGFALLPLALPPLAEFVVLVAATVAGCWLFYAVGRSLAPIRPLIGLRPRRRASPRPQDARPALEGA